MNCETCPKREFVHADLYCQDCQDKPKPKIKKGMAYMYPKSTTTCRPITSVEVEAIEGLEKAYSGIALLDRVKIEFIEDDNDKLVKTILKEINNGTDIPSMQY